MVRSCVVMAFCLAVWVASFSSLGSSLPKLSSRAFTRASMELDEIEVGDDAEGLRAEWDLARKWIDEGRAFLAEGRMNKAAVLAERLSIQIELIRALVATQRANTLATRAETKALRLEKRLKLLRVRYDRLVLEERARKGHRGEMAPGRGSSK